MKKLTDDIFDFLNLISTNEIKKNKILRFKIKSLKKKLKSIRSQHLLLNNYLGTSLINENLESK